MTKVTLDKVWFKKQFIEVACAFFFVPILLWKLAFDRKDAWPFVKRVWWSG